MVVIPTTIFQYNKQSLLTYRVDPGEFFHYSTLDVQIPCQSRKSGVKKNVIQLDHIASYDGLPLLGSLLHRAYCAAQ